MSRRLRPLPNRTFAERFIRITLLLAFVLVGGRAQRSVHGNSCPPYVATYIFVVLVRAMGVTGSIQTGDDRIYLEEQHRSRSCREVSFNGKVNDVHRQLMECHRYGGVGNCFAWSSDNV